MPSSDDGACCCYSRPGCGLGSSTRMRDRKDGGKVRVKSGRGRSDGGCEPPRASYKRLGAIARRAAILLGGTAAMALLISQPARAISINDLVVPTLDAASGYYDSTNKYPNVAAPVLPSGETFCTGSLINSRTILTAAHCFAPGLQIAGVSFNQTEFSWHHELLPTRFRPQYRFERYRPDFTIPAHHHDPIRDV